MPTPTVEPPGRSAISRLVQAGAGRVPGWDRMAAQGTQQPKLPPAWAQLFKPQPGQTSSATDRMNAGMPFNANELQELMLKRQMAALNRVYQR